MSKTNVLQFWRFNRLSWLQTWHSVIHCLDLIATWDCNQTEHLRTMLVISEEWVLEHREVGGAPLLVLGTQNLCLSFPYAFVLFFQTAYSWSLKSKSRSIYLIFRSEQCTTVACWGSRPFHNYDGGSVGKWGWHSVLKTLRTADELGACAGGLKRCR